MRLYLLFPFLFIGIFAVAQDSDYRVDLLNKNLTENANAVVRYDEMVVELSSQRQMTLERKRAVTVLNEKGKSYAMAYVAYDDSRKVKNIQAIIYDATGKELDKIKEKDFKYTLKRVNYEAVYGYEADDIKSALYIKDWNKINYTPPKTLKDNRN